MPRSGVVLKAAAAASVFLLRGGKRPKVAAWLRRRQSRQGGDPLVCLRFGDRVELPFTKLAAKLPRLHDNRGGGGGGSVYSLTRLAFNESSNSNNNNNKSSSSLEKQNSSNGHASLIIFS